MRYSSFYRIIMCSSNASKEISCGCNPRVLDLKTPRNVYLTAFYKRSFAFHTVKTRMPRILTQVIDNLVRSKDEIKEEYGEASQEELKIVIGQLSKLNYEIQTNKTLSKFNSISADVAIYNEYIQKQATEEGHARFFNTIWLLAECYMYRKIREFFEFPKAIRNYDPFKKQKQESYVNALPMIKRLTQHLGEVLSSSEPEANKDVFIHFLKLNLWSNKCDLSLSNGILETDNNKLFDVHEFDQQILCDHSEQIWEAVSDENNSSRTIDIIFDNAGYELFTDLCLADYLISMNLAKKVRLYVKTIPWFISDVTAPDFRWLINQLKSSEDQEEEEEDDANNASSNKLAEKWEEYLQNEIWELVEHQFWTLPFDYTYMSKTDVELYKKLADAKLVIFKGDLNYRKLFGEKNWDPVTPIEEALQGFNPTKLCALRTIKADIVCGLKEGVAEEIEEKDPKWMETGNYGLIQFSDKIVVVD